MSIVDAAKNKAKHSIKILKSDMSEDMVADIIHITDAVFEKCGPNPIHKDVATSVKGDFDAKYPPTDNKATSGVYHCVCGTNFACSVTHETHFSCYWQCDNVKLLLYKSKDSPFD